MNSSILVLFNFCPPPQCELTQVVPLLTQQTSTIQRYTERKKKRTFTVNSLLLHYCSVKSQRSIFFSFFTARNDIARVSGLYRARPARFFLSPREARATSFASDDPLPQYIRINRIALFVRLLQPLSLFSPLSLSSSAFSSNNLRPTLIVFVVR